MITRRFIEKVHNVFDELNYHENKSLNYDEFEKNATKTISHAKEFEDAKNAINLMQFCLKKWNKIETMFNKKLIVFNQYTYEGNSFIETVSDEEASVSFYITNGINRRIKDIAVISHSFDDELFGFSVKNGRISLYEDGDYFIKDSKMSAVKMKLFDKRNNVLCNIVLSKDYDIFLEKNKTPYEFIIYDEFIGIYDKTYIDSLSDKDMIDANNLLGTIEWDLLSKKLRFGLAKVEIYDENIDIEMILEISASTFLLYDRFRKKQKGYLALLMSRY